MNDGNRIKKGLVRNYRAMNEKSKESRPQSALHNYIYLASQYIYVHICRVCTSSSDVSNYICQYTAFLLLIFRFFFSLSFSIYLSLNHSFWFFQFLHTLNPCDVLCGAVFFRVPIKLSHLHQTIDFKNLMKKQTPKHSTSYSIHAYIGL